MDLPGHVKGLLEARFRTLREELRQQWRGDIAEQIGNTIRGGKVQAALLGGTVNAQELQGRAVAATAPSSGEVLKWGGSAWAPATDATGGGAALYVAEIDGAPEAGTVSYIKVSNGKLTNDGGGTVTLDLSGSIGTTIVMGDASAELATGTDKNPIPMEAPTTLTITEVRLKVKTAPTGAAIIVDIHKAGTTIFTNQANRPQIAATATEGNTTTIDVTGLVKGDDLTFDIDQVGSTIAGGVLMVQLICTQGVS